MCTQMPFVCQARAARPAPARQSEKVPRQRSHTRTTNQHQSPAALGPPVHNLPQTVISTRLSSKLCVTSLTHGMSQLINACFELRIWAMNADMCHIYVYANIIHEYTKMPKKMPYTIIYIYFSIRICTRDSNYINK